MCVSENYSLEIIEYGHCQGFGQLGGRKTLMRIGQLTGGGGRDMNW